MYQGTYKDQCIDLLLEHNSLTAVEISKLIIADRNLTGNKARYLSGSISSALKKLKDQGILTVSKTETGVRGGMKYEIKMPRR